MNRLQENGPHVHNPAQIHPGEQVNVRQLQPRVYLRSCVRSPTNVTAIASATVAMHPTRIHVVRLAGP
jgi:hypothetical protein